MVLESDDCLACALDWIVTASSSQLRPDCHMEAVQARDSEVANENENENEDNSRGALKLCWRATQRLRMRMRMRMKAT
jgi:hypothetical protein